MECSDGSPMIHNYHCREDGGKCHLPRGGDCYKLDKKPQAGCEAVSADFTGCKAVVELCEIVLEANRLLDTPDMGGKNYHKAKQKLQKAKKLLPVVMKAATA